MLFNSLHFLVFFPIVMITYFFIVHKVKKNWLAQFILLISSLYFYMCWKAEYLLLIMLSVTITWASGIFMDGKSQKRKTIILLISLISNFSILFFFKYANFFSSSLSSLFVLWNVNIALPNFNVLLPVGISFYTFQALGYSIDVYKGKIQPERNFMTYALFVTFFPQLVAGPIERTSHLLPQFKTDYPFDYDRVTDGLKLAAWGMFKKVVVADRLAEYVNLTYNNVDNALGLSLLIATFFFTFQILCDFSGYSDIAIGVSRILGFDLMQNFRRPYFAKSIAEFWKRWHISLSTWFKDYLYIPLGGNRVSIPHHYVNLFITFLVSGLWHGANWTFVAWGALHGGYQIAGLIMKPFRIAAGKKLGLENSNPLLKLFQVCFTFSLVCFAWIFFRANNINDALYVVQHIWTFPMDIITISGELLQNGFGSGVFKNLLLGISRENFLICFILPLILLVIDFINRRKNGLVRIRHLPLVTRWACYYILLCAILFFGAFGSNSQFIYFQF